MDNASQYLRPESEEYFRVSQHQLSCYPIHESGRTYEQILNDDGLAKFKEIKQKYELGEYKDTIYNYKIRWERSGSWYKDESSQYKWINYEDEGEIHGMINAWNNMGL